MSLPADQTGGYDAGYQTGGYDSAGYEPGGHETGYETGTYDSAGYETGGYEAEAAAGRGAHRAGHAAAEYPEADVPAGQHWPEVGGYQSDVTGQQRFPETDDRGYAGDRFVPPYVRAVDESYSNDNPGAASDEGRGQEPEAYPDDRQPGPSAEEQYAQPQRSTGGYFDRPDYSLAVDPAALAAQPAGRHAGEQGSTFSPAQEPEQDFLAAGHRQAERDYRGRPRR